MRKSSGLKSSDAKMKDLTVGLEEWPVVEVFPKHRTLGKKVMLGGTLDFVPHKGNHKIVKVLI